MMVIPSLRMAGLICRHMPPAGFQRTTNSADNIGQILLRHMQKRSGRYHRIIALKCIQFVMLTGRFKRRSALAAISATPSVASTTKPRSVI